MTKIAISSGHGLYVRGASGSPIPPQLDEVDMARQVTNRVAELLANVNSLAGVFHDNTSYDQSTNLDTIVSWHNDQQRDYDVSVHLNYYNGVANGTEVLYVTQDYLAYELSAAISTAGSFVNRGGKYNGGLAFLNGTSKPAVLLELMFCDHTGDCQKMKAGFEPICLRIAEVLAGRSIGDITPPRPEWPEDLPPRPPAFLFTARGRCSTFGGPSDEGVGASEGLAFIYPGEENKFAHLFLPEQPSGTTGLARRLDTNIFYVACRWPYEEGVTKDMLRDQSLKAAVRNPRTGKKFAAYPADWGPHEEETGRAADISPGLMTYLGIETDDEVEVIYPAPAMIITS